MQLDTVAPYGRSPSLLRSRRLRSVKSVLHQVPSRRIEYGYFIFLCYSMLSEPLGLTIPLLAFGMMGVLAALCARWAVPLTGRAYGPTGLLLACGASFIAIQLLVHDESLSGEIRVFVTWLLGVVIVQALCLRRGFLHRCSLVFLLIGVAVLPYLSEIGDGARARIDLNVGGHLSHPNGLGDWFGFCAVYFAIVGLETNRGRTRTIAWLVAVGCLLVVGLTVSRGALLATALGTTVAFRRLLKRGFVPLLGVIVLVGVAYASGLFAQSARQLSERGMEETGRERLWPAAIERILGSPLVGVGTSNVETLATGANMPAAPHNSFLYFALAAGLVPFTLWVAFWVRAFTSHPLTTESRESREHSPFRLPFLVYAFVVVMLGDLAFMSPWALLALSVGASGGMSHRARRDRRIRATGASVPRRGRNRVQSC